MAVCAVGLSHAKNILKQYFNYDKSFLTNHLDATYDITTLENNTDKCCVIAPAVRDLERSKAAHS